MTSSMQPGWHDDPDDASAQRYWDGQAWTPHRRRKPRTAQPPAPSAPPPAAPSGFPPPPVQQPAGVATQPAGVATQPAGVATQPSNNPDVNIGAWPAPPTPQQPPPPPVAGQYGQYGQYGQPAGQWPPATPQAPAKAKTGGSAAKVLLSLVVVVAVIAGAVVLLIKSGILHLETKKLAVAEVQTEVQKVLVDRVTGYTSSDITSVTCNNGQDPTVKQGGSFTCNVTDRGKKHQLTVTFTDGSGTYEVGLPQLSGGK